MIHSFSLCCWEGGVYLFLFFFFLLTTRVVGVKWRYFLWAWMEGNCLPVDFGGYSAPQRESMDWKGIDCNNKLQ